MRYNSLIIWEEAYKVYVAVALSDDQSVACYVQQRKDLLPLSCNLTDALQRFNIEDVNLALGASKADLPRCGRVCWHTEPVCVKDPVALGHINRLNVVLALVCAN